MEQTADVLLLQSANVMRKSMSIHAFLPDSWHQRALHHGLLASSMYMFFTLAAC